MDLVNEMDHACKIRRMFQVTRQGLQTCPLRVLPGSDGQSFCPHPPRQLWALLEQLWPAQGAVLWANLLRTFAQLALDEWELVFSTFPSIRKGQAGSYNQISFLSEWFFFSCNNYENSTHLLKRVENWAAWTSSCWSKCESRAICWSESHSRTNWLTSC